MAKSSDKSMAFFMGCLAALVVVCLICAVGGFFMPYKFWTSNSPTEPAKNYLKEHPAVKENLGEVKDFGKFPSMSVNTTNGKGSAHMVFQLKGSKGEGTATLDMAKEPKKAWTVVYGELDVGGKKVPLTGGSPPPPPNKPEEEPFPPPPPPPPQPNPPAENNEGSATA